MLIISTLFFHQIHQFHLFFNPNRGLKKPVLLIINSYIVKHPIDVNATVKTNFNSVEIPSGNIMNEPK